MTGSGYLRILSFLLMITEIAQQIAAKLRQARRVLLIPGTHPDGDSISSTSAMFLYLKMHGVPASIFSAINPPESLLFLPHADESRTDTAIFHDETIDTIVVFDAGDLRYAGIADKIPLMPRRPVIINIDHHASNENFGDLNLVIKDAAATTEVLYNFFRAINHPIHEDLATCLLTGLMTDTDHFSNSATTASAMAMASDLLVRGARLHVIRKNTQNNKSVTLLKLWGIALARLYYQPGADAVITYLFQKDYESYGMTSQEVEGISDFMNKLGEGRYVLFLKETPDGQVKGSFRTTHDDVDVAKLALRLGGGGHKKAAGFTVPGRLEETDRGVKIVQK